MDVFYFLPVKKRRQNCFYLKCLWNAVKMKKLKKVKIFKVFFANM